MVVIGFVVCTPMGCGGDTNSSSTTGQGPVVAQDFPAVAAEAICDRIGPCCQKAGVAYDPAGCRSSVAAFFGHIGRLGADGGAAYDASSSGACLLSLAAAAPSCELQALSLDSPACIQTVEASRHRRAGEPCNMECSRGTHEGQCYGVAVPATSSALSICYLEDGLFCDLSTSTCREQFELGAACTGSEQCRVGGCQDGICVPPLDAGGKCGTNLRACAQGLYCEPTDAELGIVGGTCVELLPEDAECHSIDACREGTCQSRCDAVAGRATFAGIVCGG
jgi:hypothetical protein